MMIRTAVFTLVLVASVVAHANEPWVEFEGRYWMPKLSAEGQFSDNGIGTKLDFKDDLGISNNEFWGGRLTFRLGQNHRLRLAYTQISYEGDKVVTENIDFADETFTFGTRVLTDFDMHYGQIGWTWQFINLFDRSFRLGTLVDLKGFGVKARLRAPDETPPQSESASIAFGLPTLGLALDIFPVKGINLYAEAAGMSAGKYGWFADGEAGLRVSPTKNLSLIAGYRLMRLDIEVSDDFIDLRIGGPFVAASINF